MGLSNSNVINEKGKVGSGNSLGCCGIYGLFLALGVIVYPFYWIYENYGWKGLLVLFLSIILVVLIVIYSFFADIEQKENETGKQRLKTKK